MNDQPRTFQELILALQTYWMEYGCVLVQPLDMEVGAGTFHPSTFLRALGRNPGTPLRPALAATGGWPLR